MACPYGKTQMPEIMSDVRAGMIRVMVAYTGEFEKGGKKFAISETDLNEMQRNLGAQREIPVDYEHLSATPGAIPPGWGRAAGWIEGAGSSIEDFVSPHPSADPSADGRKALWVWFRPTPVCLAMIKQQEYRKMSPEIHWDENDEHGQSIGTRLAAVAVTNRPFLKELPPMELSDDDYQSAFGLAASEDGRLAAVTLSERGKLVMMDVGARHGVPLQEAARAEKENNHQSKQKGATMKKFKLKKLTGVKGRRVVMDDGDEPLGEVSFDELDLDDGELDELLAGRAGGKTMNELLAERVGVRGAHGDAPSLEQIREDVALGEAARTEKAADDRRKLLLGEGLRDGVILSDKVKQFAREGKITLEEYMNAEETHQKLAEAVRCGKVLPRDRQFFFEVGLRNPSGFDRWLMGAPKVIDLVTRGLGSTAAPASVEDEVMARTREYMTEHKMNDEQYGKAMRKVLASDRELDRRFRAVAQERVVGPQDVGH